MKIKMFSKIAVGDKSSESKMISLLSSKQLFFNVKWTKDSPLLLFQLNFVVNKGPSKDALNGQAVKDTDGDITILLGSFKGGDSIEVSFGVKGFSKIPRVFVTLSQTEPGQILKRDPESGFKSLDPFDDWEDTLTVTVN